MPPDPDEGAALALLRLAWRLDDLDRWREHVDRELGAVSVKLEKLDRSEEIAREVTRRLRSSGRPLPFAWWQKIGALLGGALILADAVKGLVS